MIEKFLMLLKIGYGSKSGHLILNPVLCLMIPFLIIVIGYNLHKGMVFHA